MKTYHQADDPYDTIRWTIINVCPKADE